MKTDDRKLAPKALAATLRKITEALAKEMACPARSAPHWSDFEWSIARAVAAMHGVSPLLSRTLRWQGPPGWMQFLAQQRAHTANRHVRIKALLSRIDLSARNAGIAAVALKGAALHALGVYEAGDRPMADVDLLVRPADAERAVRLLESLGFRQAYVTWKERVFFPMQGVAPAALGEHADNDIKIELHTYIRERLPWRITDASEAIFPRTSSPGLNAYPSPAALMIHLLFHAAGSMTAKGLRLMHLNDIARLSSRMTRLDWHEVLSNNSSAAALWWAFPPLNLTSRYYPSSVPADVLKTLTAECPSLLAALAKRRTLYDVSFSYLWVDAFPGIEWSRSIGDALQYVANRVRPSTQLLALREHFASTEVGENQNPWVRLSQRRRVLRWLVSRPTRVFAASAVDAALAQALDRAQ